MKYAKELATITGNLKLSTSVALVLDRKLKVFFFLLLLFELTVTVYSKRIDACLHFISVGSYLVFTYENNTTDKQEMI